MGPRENHFGLSTTVPRQSRLQGNAVKLRFQLALIILSLVIDVPPMRAQEPSKPERTLDEIKAEAIHRAENGMYPLIGLDPADVREALGSVKTRDKDEWAAAFMGVADRYMSEAKTVEASDAAKANADYIRAWRLYSFGRWPIPASAGKQRSYEKALEAFRAHAHFLDPPLEVVRIPFEGREIIGYMRLPKNAKAGVPLVIAVNGLDSRKEDLSESFAAILPYGIGFLAVDGPGTGQSPIKVSETADRMLSRVLDYVQRDRKSIRAESPSTASVGALIGRRSLPSWSVRE